MRVGNDDGGVCALCGMLLPRGQFAQLLTVGPIGEGEKVKVCSDSSACRRRAIEIVRGYEKLKL